MAVRAKFHCQTETTAVHNRQAKAARTYRFMAVYDPNLPEDQRYALATPIGELTMQVDNPAVIFEPGKAYYLDITPAE